MNSYRDLLEVLKKLSVEQLDSKIVILNEGVIDNREIEILINKEALYEFKDSNMETYFDFETHKNAKEYECIKILDKKYPIITLK